MNRDRVNNFICVARLFGPLNFIVNTATTDNNNASNITKRVFKCHPLF